MIFIDRLNHLEILTGYGIWLFGVSRRKGGGCLDSFAVHTIIAIILSQAIHYCFFQQDRSLIMAMVCPLKSPEKEGTDYISSIRLSPMVES